jgi:threonylcarbamoyladenosine tRNA methylthiotransferase MtaB
MPSPTRERAVLKIQDGCNHKCSYCIIPSVRGASVTKSRDAALAEARTFVREGARELTVTGVSMSDWKASTVEIDRTLRRGESKNAALNSLLRAVSSIEGLERVRVSSLDPADVDDAWLETLANTPKICPHIHLALQSGSAGVLRRMRRRYTPEMYLRAARRWRELRPDGGLTTDIIVGFPGETEEEWQETMNLARAAQFSAIHVFPYSPRAGTAAASFDNMVAPTIQNRRVDELLALAKELSANYAAQFFGAPQSVFVENVKEGIADGLTEHYVRARVPVGATTRAGDLVWFTPTRWDGDALQP